MNYDGKKNTKLWGYRAKVRAGKQDPRRGFLRISSRLEDEPDSIMITTQDGYGTYATRRLRKMNIYNGRVTPGERSSIRRATFLVDIKGTTIIQWGWMKPQAFVLPAKGILNFVDPAKRLLTPSPALLHLIFRL
jgi:hypothetical protein